MNKFIDFIKNADKRQWYWLFEIGVPKRKTNIYNLRINNFAELEKPVFFCLRAEQELNGLLNYWRKIKI